MLVIGCGNDTSGGNFQVTNVQTSFNDCFGNCSQNTLGTCTAFTFSGGAGSQNGVAAGQCYLKYFATESFTGINTAEVGAIKLANYATPVSTAPFAGPTYTCPAANMTVQTDPSGVHYPTTSGIGYCDAFTYVGGANGVGAGTCYPKAGTTESFTGSNNIFAAAIRLNVYSGPAPTYPSTTAGATTTTGSSTSSGSASIAATPTTSSAASSTTITGAANTVTYTTVSYATYTTVSYATQTYTTSYVQTTTQVSTAPGTTVTGTTTYISSYPVTTTVVPTYSMTYTTTQPGSTIVSTQPAQTITQTLKLKQQLHADKQPVVDWKQLCICIELDYLKSAYLEHVCGQFSKQLVVNRISLRIGLNASCCDNYNNFFIDSFELIIWDAIHELGEHFYLDREQHRIIINYLRILSEHYLSINYLQPDNVQLLVIHDRADHAINIKHLPIYVRPATDGHSHCYASAFRDGDSDGVAIFVAVMKLCWLWGTSDRRLHHKGSIDENSTFRYYGPSIHEATAEERIRQRPGYVFVSRAGN
ncbi:hypothetical protein LTR85_005653 [Meristemomyces frigidus]|nr:hypothetical protein LTR85_005653 [Meristemomyces frigidus]